MRLINQLFLMLIKIQKHFPENFSDFPILFSPHILLSGALLMFLGSLVLKVARKVLREVSSWKLQGFVF